MVAGHNDSGKYDINKDEASIYIQEGGSVDVENLNDKYKKYPVVGSKVVINADESVEIDIDFDNITWGWKDNDDDPEIS